MTTTTAETHASVSQTLAQPRKLTYVLNRYSESDASHYAHVTHLLEELAARGIQIRLLVEKGNATPRFRSPNIEARVLSSTDVPNYFALMRQLLRAIRDGYSTIFVRISPRAALLAVLARRLRGGQVFFWHSGTTIAHDRAKPWNAAKLRWLLLSRVPALLVQRFCDFLVTGPEAMVEYYATEAGVDRRRIRLLYNDIDVTRFHRSHDSNSVTDAMRRSLEIPDGTLCLLFVHRLSSYRRSLFYLPYIAAELMTVIPQRAFVCVMVGAGPELPALRAAVTEAGLDHVFKFLGDIPNSRMQQLYWGADIFVQASHSEGFPRVLIEAMAAGLPIVTTDAGGTMDILGPLQRKFVAPRDERAQLVHKLAELFEDPEQRAALARENEAVVERFATPRVAEMYDRVLFQR